MNVDIEAILAHVREHLDTEEGKRELRELLERSKRFAEKLRRDSRVDPAILREPMTI